MRRSRSIVFQESRDRGLVGAESERGALRPVLERVTLGAPGVSVVETIALSCVLHPSGKLHPRRLGQAHPPWLGQLPFAVG